MPKIVGDDGAEHEAEEHRDGGEEAPAEEALQDDDEQQGRAGQLEVLEGPEVVGGRVAAARAAARPTGSSVMPMTVITVPVTTGGNSRSRREKYGAIRNVTTPATITAP